MTMRYFDLNATCDAIDIRSNLVLDQMCVLYKGVLNLTANFANAAGYLTFSYSSILGRLRFSNRLIVSPFVVVLAENICRLKEMCASQTCQISGSDCHIHRVGSKRGPSWRGNAFNH
jgi:hypothetical protein